MVSLIVKTVHLIKTCSWSNIDLTADDWLYSLSFTCFVEVNTTVHYTVVGDSNGRLAKFFYMLYKRFDTTGTVKDTVLRMYMQMCEINHNLFSLSVICVLSVFTKIMFIKKI